MNCKSAVAGYLHEIIGMGGCRIHPALGRKPRAPTVSRFRSAGYLLHDGPPCKFTLFLRIHLACIVFSFLNGNLISVTMTREWIA